jgi:hypothetical protein
MRRLCCRELQGREWIGGVYAVLTRQVQYSDSRHLRGYMSELSVLHVLGSRERAADQLYLQQGVYRTGRCGMCGMYSGDIQGRERLGAVLTVLSGQVLDRDRRDARVDVQPVSGIHVLTRRQLDADQLYLQQGIHGP